MLGVESADKVFTFQLSECGTDVGTFFRFIPKEEHALAQFFFGCFGRVDGVHGVGMHSAVPRFGADGHRGGGEILHLFQSEIQLFGFGCQFGHVFSCASRVGRDEVGDDLLLQPTFAVDTVEDAFEVVELLERGLSHQVQHAVGSVLRCHF